MLNRPAASSRNTRHGGAGVCGMPMGAAGGRVHADRAPVDPAFSIGIGLDGPQDPLPRAVRRPPAMPVVHCLPPPEPCWQITPWDTGPLSAQNAVDHPARAAPTPASSHVLRQVRLQPSPLLIRQITPPHTGRNDVNAGLVTRPIGQCLGTVRRIMFVPSRGTLADPIEVRLAQPLLRTLCGTEPRLVLGHPTVTSDRVGPVEASRRSMYC